jgi:N-carbamoylputrescine amidase
LPEVVRQLGCRRKKHLLRDFVDDKGKTMTTKKNIAWIQGRWRGDAESTMTWYMDLIREKAAPGTIAILPELSHTPYFPQEESPVHFDLAISKTHDIFHAMADLAQKTQSVIVFPFFEKRSVGIYHNSAAVFNTNGSISGFYRKSHIPDDPGFYEKFYFHPGDTGMVPIRTALGSIGVLICWDQWFPEAARLMALRGADILIYPTAIGFDVREPESIYADQLDSWMVSMRGHAVANGIFVAAVNRTGLEGPLRFWGNSFVAGPTGRILHQCAETDEGFFQISIDSDDMENQRRMWPFFRDRRIDQYGDLQKRWID